MSELFRNKYRIPSARAEWWDYSSDGAYFITICTANRKHFFGGIENGKMTLSKIGQNALKFWLQIPEHFPFAQLGANVVMPNHVHGIIAIDKSQILQTPGITSTSGVTPTSVVETPNLGVSTGITRKNDGESQKWHSGTIGVIINQYKRMVTIESRGICDDFTWQPRYYDRIIRDESAYKRIANYIINNPSNWKEDALWKN